MYIDKAKKKFNLLKGKTDSIILGIESSCDETACSVTKGFSLLSNVVASQIDIHSKFGGVVPEIASRNHTETIISVIDQALKNASLTLNEIDAIAVTSNPGLIGSLLVGLSTAKSICLAKNIPLISVNHIEAHICANYIDNPSLKPPFLALVASGGHTSIIEVKGFNKYSILGATTDDAIGEAFDKVARLLGLPYPGGPSIDKLAREGNANIEFTKQRQVNKDLLLSYSGLKTAVVNYVHKKRQNNEQINIKDISASFNKQSVDILIETLLYSQKKYKYKTIVLSGGVASNSYLRNQLSLKCNQENINLIIPKIEYCTDNAGMVAIRGFLSAYENKNLAFLDINASSTGVY